MTLCRIGLYLWSRGLSGRLPDGLLFEEASEYYEDGQKRMFPAMVAELTHPERGNVGFHVTYLDPEGVGKADVRAAKKLTPTLTQGETNGAAIRLAPAGEVLCLTEGIETGIAVMEATGKPVWACISAGGLEKVIVPLDVHHVEIWADHDLSGRGQEAAEKLMLRLREEGRVAVTVYVPPIRGPGKGIDWLDVFNAHGAKALLKAKSEGEKPKIRNTDLGNAKRFVNLHGLDLLHDNSAKDWFVWDGTRWALDTVGEVPRRAKATVADMFRESYLIEDDLGRDLRKHAYSSEGAKSIKAMVELASSESEFVTSARRWDSDPLLFNCANGTVDLSRCELRPALRRDRCLKRSPVAYDAAATCPQWERFIDEVTDGDEELAGYLQRAAGYSLTGETREHVFFLHVGAGRNGKGVFLNVLRHIAGDYGLQTSPETFMLRDRPTGGPTPELARLQGARLVCASEAEENQRLSVALVKQITGGDPITARHLHSPPIQFDPQFKVHFASNHRPSISDTNTAIWSRVRLVPWRVSFLGREDRGLEARLKLEAPGILNWCLIGTLHWLENGLGVPPAVEDATAQYRSDMDVVGQWLDECAEENAQETASASGTYQSYTSWCKDSGHRPFSAKRLKESLTERGFIQKRNNSGLFWMGFYLKSKFSV